MITYIIETSEGEVYCGKTINLDNRIKEHLKEKYPHWFSMLKRKEWRNVFFIEGDYENRIKKFGVKHFLLVSRYLKIKGIASPDHEVIK